MDPMGLFFVAAGAFTITGAVFNWDWFMNVGQSKFMVKILTRNGDRVLYGILGLAKTVLGVLVTVDIINISQ